MKKRLLSTLCALCLCLTLLPTAALADGLETGTPTLLNGEGETDYATPSEEDGWTQLSDGTWFLVAEKTYDQPLRSENPILIDSNAILTAPSITVDGFVDVSGSAYLICSGELSAKELQVSSSVTVGTFSCSKVNVSAGGKLTVTTKWNCSGKVNVDKNSTLNLPAGTEPDWGNFSGEGTVQIGDMAYDTAGNEQGTAMLILTSGASASGEGYIWDRDTCTLTLDGFARTYDTEAEGGIGIQAEGRAITLVLKGENVMNGLEAAGISCVGSSLTLKGTGSLDCEGSAGALMIYGGSLALAEGYSLNEEADIFNETSGAGGMVIEAGTDETGPIPATSFTISGTITGVTAQGRAYDGSATVTITGVTLGGVIDNDDVSVDTSGLTGTLSSADAGTYYELTLTGTVNLTGADKGNYTLTLPTEGMTVTTVNDGSGVTIQKAALTVTAPSETITVGDPIPDLNSLKVTVTGLVGNDTFSGVTLTYDGNPDNSQPGTWAIEPSGASLTTGNMSNYTVSYVNGTLTVKKKPVSGGGTSGGTTTPSGPSTGGSDGWTEIEDEVDETPSGSTVTVDMNGTTEVPAEVFEAVAGKDVTLELDMGGGVKWEINGQDIPTDLDITDLDLGVSLNTSDIPMDVINMVTGEKSTVQLSLAHDGEFGFTMTLTAPVGTQNKGLWANLYHYDTTRKQMLFETAAQVDASGNVALKLSHASEYAIVLDESSHELPFTDTAKGAWYQGAVEYVYRNSIMTGTSATSFEPNAPLSRAMVAQILYNLEGQPTVEGESTFADASGHWAVNAIAWAQQTGVVNGYEDNTFRPNRAVSREELAQMLYNYAKVKGYDLTASGDLTAFPDGSKVSSWAEAAMAWANGNELINGHDDGTLQPGGDSTRAQAASILMSFDLNLAN